MTSNIVDTEVGPIMSEQGSQVLNGGVYGEDGVKVLEYPFSDEIIIDRQEGSPLKLIQFILQNLLDERETDLRNKAIELSHMLGREKIYRSEVEPIISELALSERFDEVFIDDLKSICGVAINSDQDCIKAFTYLGQKYGSSDDVSKTFQSAIKFLSSEDGTTFDFDILSDLLTFPENPDVDDKDTDLVVKCNEYLISIVSC